jgi:hypothetical protein
MNKKITKRDVFFFFMGIAVLFFLDIIFNWEETVNIIKEGYNDGYEAGENFSN